MNIYLIRHTSVDVPKGICYGQTDVPLKGSFLEEAETIKKQIQHIPFDKVYASPLSRCIKLANYCFNLPIEQSQEILELNFGDWEMQKWDVIGEHPWWNDWVNVSTLNGESYQQMYRRVAFFFNKITAQSSFKNIAIVAHGGVLACSRTYFKGIPLEKSFKEPINYGEIMTYQI